MKTKTVPTLENIYEWLSAEGLSYTEQGQHDEADMCFAIGARLAGWEYALKAIAGQVQWRDNLMGNPDIARFVLEDANAKAN